MDNALQDNWVAGSTLPPRRGIDNGVLTVKVLTSLTAPASGSVQLMFFARGAENLEFANPDEFVGSESNSYTVPSFFNLQADDKTDVVASQIAMGPTTLALPERYGLNFGEAVHSLRDLLHRSTVADTVILPTGTASKVQVLRKRYRRMPYSPGYIGSSFPTVASNIVAASGSTSYAFCGMHPLPYVAGMFLGYRGGVSYTVTPSTDAYGYVDDVRVVRTTSNFGETTAQRYAEVSTNVLPAGHTLSQGAAYMGRQEFIRDGASGLAITSNKTNATVSFMIPDYNMFNFSLVDPQTAAYGSATDGTRNQGALLSLSVKNATGDDVKQSTISVMSTAAAAPDFTCLYFLCCPTLDFSLAAPLTP